MRERLRRVRGEVPEQDLSLRVFVGGMPFSYEVSPTYRSGWQCGRAGWVDM